MNFIVVLRYYLFILLIPLNFPSVVRILRQFGTSHHTYILDDGRTPVCDLARINLLTPNVNYSGRTAPLTSKVAFYIFIQQI